MKTEEFDALMVECGLLPINKLEWNGKAFVGTDEFIDGDYVALRQFVREALKLERNRLALMCEQMGIQGHGSLAIAAAIRKENDNDI